MGVLDIFSAISNADFTGGIKTGTAILDAYGGLAQSAFGFGQQLGGYLFGGSNGGALAGAPGVSIAPAAPLPAAVPGKSDYSTTGTMESLPMNGNGFPLVVSGRRGLVPFAGAQSWPGMGYHIAMRPGRAPTAGRQPGMYWVPNRRMNPLNPRALARAERRVLAAQRWARRIVKIARSIKHRRGGRRRKK